MSTQPLGIRVVCDFKRSASCREYIDTGAIQTVNARIIAQHDGWETLPESPKPWRARHMRHAQSVTKH